MTISDVANKFNARRESKVWRAKCPVHQGNRKYGRSLAIYADEDRVGLYCFGGCNKDDILSSVGLSWKDTLYNDKFLTPEEKKAWAKQKHIAEAYRVEVRRQGLVTWLNALECKQKPVRTQTRFERDINRAYRTDLPMV